MSTNYIQIIQDTNFEFIEMKHAKITYIHFKI